MTVALSVIAVLFALGGLYFFRQASHEGDGGFGSAFIGMLFIAIAVVLIVVDAAVIIHEMHK
jgi:hypothetical protein